MTCISRKVSEPAANKEEMDGKSKTGEFESIGCFLFWLISLFFFNLFFLLKHALAEEDMMMDSVQSVSPAQPTEELTELGKCLLKHEVDLKRITYHSEESTVVHY